MNKELTKSQTSLSLPNHSKDLLGVVFDFAFYKIRVEEVHPYSQHPSHRPPGLQTISDPPKISTRYPLFSFVSHEKAMTSKIPLQSSSFPRHETFCFYRTYRNQLSVCHVYRLTVSFCSCPFIVWFGSLRFSDLFVGPMGHQKKHTCSGRVKPQIQWLKGFANQNSIFHLRGEKSCRTGVSQTTRGTPSWRTCTMNPRWQFKLGVETFYWNPSILQMLLVYLY